MNIAVLPGCTQCGDQGLHSLYTPQGFKYSNSTSDFGLGSIDIGPNSGHVEPQVQASLLLA